MFLFTEHTVSKETMFAGRVFQVELHSVVLPDGRHASREIVRHNGGACIVALDERQHVYLVRQFRKPYDMEMLELPAGKLELGEDPLVCARRELREETGLDADRITLLSTVYPSPGYCSETLSVYLATGLTVGQSQLDEGEFLDLHVYPLEQALDMIDSGEIRDAKTQIGLLKVARLLSQGQIEGV